MTPEMHISKDPKLPNTVLQPFEGLNVNLWRLMAEQQPGITPSQAFARFRFAVRFVER